MKRSTFGRLKGLILFLLIGLTSSLWAQPDLAQIDKYIEKARKDWDVPGLAVAIVIDGEIVHAKGYGVLEQGKKEKVDEHSLFAIASNTKAFIATSLSMLVEEGKLKWDDPVIKYLPYFSLYDSYTSQNTTVRDLLCHRVGLGTFSGDVIWFKSNYTAEEVVKHIRFVPQAYGFRSGYGYSNLMYITAGEVIKAVSGQSWAEFVRENILEPVGMDRTQTSVLDLKGMDNVAIPHKPDWEGHNHPISWVPWEASGAAGGLISSVHDMALWMIMHMNEGLSDDGDTLLYTSSQRLMWHPHNNMMVSPGYQRRYPSTHFRGYGLGWSLNDYLGRKVVAHGGGYDGMYSRVMMVPEADFGVVVLTNSMKGISTYLCNYITDQVFMAPTETKWSEIGLQSQRNFDRFRANREKERLDARQTNTRASFGLANYAGTYHSDLYGDINIVFEDRELRMEIPHAPALNADLEHWHYDTFEIEWDEEHAWFGFGTLRFEMDNNGKIIGAAFDVPNDDIFFEEIELVKVK
jgi:CubicO group peptidase (beta-lactamase class C family)